MADATSIDWRGIERERLEEMQRAGNVVLDCLRRMGKSHTNPVRQILGDQVEFIEFEHYPPGDIYDEESASQYYYHAHRTESGEHGHLHLFIRAAGIPSDIEPLAAVNADERPLGPDAICHLIAISMDGEGLPCSMFTTNRWVTGETLYAAADVIRLLDRFDVDHVTPCLATNRFVSSLVRLFRPQIEALVRDRDRCLRDWSRTVGASAVFEHEALEVTSSMPIDIDAQIERLDAELSSLGLCCAWDVTDRAGTRRA